MLRLKSINFQQQAFSEYELPQKHPGQMEWVIGRSETCDLVLESPEISKVHGRVQFSEGSYYFVELGSKNGSSINGKELQPNQKAVLQVGDLLQLGETYLHIEDVLPPPVMSEAVAQFGEAGRWTAEELIVRCTRIIQETPDTKTFCLVGEPRVRFANYLPGQFTNLAVEIDGQQVVRPYSLASSPTSPHSLWLTVKRVPSSSPDTPPGLVSNWLHDNLSVGDRLKLLGGPLGTFTFLPEVPPKLLLVSAGSGITPMMSMARWVYDFFAETDVVFLHSACTPKDIPFYRELELMDKYMRNFQLAITITRDEPDTTWSGFRGRVSQPMLQMVAPDLHERRVFVCGSHGFMQSIQAHLQALNFPMENYQEESFGGASRSVAPKLTTKAVSQSEANQPSATSDTQLLTATHELNSDGKEPSSSISVVFTQSQKEVAGDGTSSLLEMAERAGVTTIAKACRMGACGTCKVIANGPVTYESEPTCLSNADKETGYVVACVAQAAGRVAIEA